MHNEAHKEATSTFVSSIPLLADGIALGLHILLLPALTAQMVDHAAVNVLLLAGFYLLFCSAVYLIRKLEPAAGEPALPQRLQSRPLRGALAVLFGVVMMLAISAQLGYLDSLLTASARQLGEGGAAVFFVLAPGAWLGFSLFYILILISDFETTIRRDSANYGRVAFFALLAVNTMLLVISAQGRVIVQNWVGPGARPLLFPFVFILLLLLFGPTRLLYQTRRPRMEGVITFLALLGYATWGAVGSL